MSSFTTPLDVRKLDDGKNWQVLTEFTFVLGDPQTPNHEHIDVPAGEITDFGSIPFFLRGIPGFNPTGRAGKAYVIHDRLYKGGGITVWTQLNTPADGSTPYMVDHYRQPSRKEADNILREGMRTLKCNGILIVLVYSGVRVGGWPVWARHRDADPSIGEETNLDSPGGAQTQSRLKE